jgi:hypothetical protein
VRPTSRRTARVVLTARAGRRVVGRTTVRVRRGGGTARLRLGRHAARVQVPIAVFSGGEHAARWTAAV